MKSKLVEALSLESEPVAILWKDDKPEGARGFSRGKWGCVMWLLAAATKGEVAAASPDTYGCWGGGVGLGFGNQYPRFPGGIGCFERFLSIGNETWETGRKVAREIAPHVSSHFLEDFLKGEGYKKTPELVADFLSEMPFFQVPTRYVVLKPLSKVDLGEEEPKVVVIVARPHQLSALVILANYRRKGFENVIIPYAAACQTMGIFPYREANSPNPRAVVGLTDISARLYLSGKLPQDSFTFSVPWSMFREMESDIEGSFLEKRTWRRLLGST